MKIGFHIWQIGNDAHPSPYEEEKLRFWYNGQIGWTVDQETFRVFRDLFLDRSRVSFDSFLRPISCLMNLIKSKQGVNQTFCLFQISCYLFY